MPSRPATFLAIGSAALLAVGGALFGVREAEQGRVRAWLAAHPGLRVAAVEVAPLGGSLLLHGIGFERGHDRLVIGTLRVPLARLALLGPATAAADTVTPPAAGPAPGTVQAEDVVATVGTTTIRIKRIDVAGTKLTDADLRTLLDAKAPDGIEARLRKLTATAVVIPEIAIDDPTRGAERHALVEKVLLAGVAAGKASALSIAETSVALTSGDDAVNASTGGIDAANADLAQLARVLGTKRTDDAEPVRPLFDKLQIDAPKLANVTRGATASAARIAATAVAARPLDESLAAAGAVAAQAGSSAASNALLLDDLTQSVSMGSLDVEDARSQAEAGGEATTIAAAHLGARDIGARGIGAVEMRGFAVKSDTARLAIGTASLGPMPAPAKAEAGEPRPASRPSQVELGGIEVEVTPRDKPAAALRFKVEHAALAQQGGPSAIPATGSATIDKLTFAATPDGLTRTFYDMGYRDVSLSAAMSSTYDSDAQELMVRKLSIGGPNIGSADIALNLAGVSQDLLSPDAETAQAAAIGVVAKSIDLKLVNGGLAEKALAFMAKRDGMSVEAERAYYVDLFSAKLPVMLGEGAGVKTLGGALAKFVADPRSLHVAIASKDGLGVATLGMLMDPGALLDTIDIQASADD